MIVNGESLDDPRLSPCYLNTRRIPEQAEISRRLASAFSWLDKIATEHARAEHLLPHLDQAILAKAFRGELVPQDLNGEPAAVLLGRIKTERDDGPPHRRART